MCVFVVLWLLRLEEKVEKSMMVLLMETEEKVNELIQHLHGTGWTELKEACVGLMQEANWTRLTIKNREEK
jgi:hypothetical protein